MPVRNPSDRPDAAPMSEHAPLLRDLARAVGARHVLSSRRSMRRFVTGYRTGQGDALAVVRPGNLVEQWRVLEACAASDVAVILQAANTGLTGGSTPWGSYSRPVVVISTLRLRGLHLIGEGRQVVCLPGATLYDLERALKPLDREPHSVIGSSCIGASVAGGVCNNSGGALVRRGPAYTELALYARIDEAGRLQLVNELGIALPGDPETVLAAVERGDFTPGAIDWADGRAASAVGYEEEVRAIHADTPARCNADPSRLHGASGSAGKVALFAARLDTFPRDAGALTYYVGTNDPKELTALRRAILASPLKLPIAAEYIHREAFDLASRYGKDMFVAIERLGTDRLPKLFAAKARLESWANGFPGLSGDIVDRVLQGVGRLLPNHLPRRIIEYRDRYEHHLLLKVGAAEGEAFGQLLTDILDSERSGFFACSPAEADKAFLQRFVVAGAAIRYLAVHRSTTEDMIALDIALPRNQEDWFEQLPPDIAASITHRVYYGHFLCHVLHQDYLVAKGADVGAIKARLLEALDARGVRYPAEHNVGHVYRAAPALEAHYRALDPRNVFNPGIGQTSREPGWQ